MACRDVCQKHVHSMEALKRHAAGLVQRNKHYVCGAFGNPGSGKSEFMALHLSDLQGFPLNVRRQIAYRPKDVKPLSESLFRSGLQAPGEKRKQHRYLALQDDEATGEGGHKRGAMTTDNRESVQDFDAMRGRNQFVGLCAPKRTDLDAIKQGHLMWAFEITNDHHYTAWEAIKSSPMWDSDTWWEDRFHSTEPIPSLDTLPPWGPTLRRDYLSGKDAHMKGRSTDAAVGRVVLEEHYYAILRRREGVDPGTTTA